MNYSAQAIFIITMLTFHYTEAINNASYETWGGQFEAWGSKLLARIGNCALSVPGRVGIALLKKFPIIGRTAQAYHRNRFVCRRCILGSLCAIPLTLWAGYKARRQITEVMDSCKNKLVNYMMNHRSSFATRWLAARLGINLVPAPIRTQEVDAPINMQTASPDIFLMECRRDTRFDDRMFLLKAAELGNAAVIREYYQARDAFSQRYDIAGFDFYNTQGLTPLHMAVQNGHREVVTAFINARAGLDVFTRGARWLTPLHIAAQKGDVQIMADLINAGALLMEGGTGANPLQTAYVNGHLQSLLSFFAPHDIDKLRLFMCVAASHGDAEVVQMLIDVCDRVYVSIVNYSIERGWVALHYASYYGHAEVVRILIAALANVDRDNLSGDTPLHLAAQNAHVDVAEILLQRGNHLLTRGGEILIRFDHNILIDARGEYGRKPLHSTLTEYGMSERRLAILNLLLKAKADVNARADNLETPLHCAANFDHSIAVKALLDARADKDAQDDQGRTPLYIATRCGHVKVVQALIAARANMLLRDSEGKTLFRFLHEGAERERRQRKPCFDLLIRTRKREVAQTLAASLHDRIGAQSPTGLLPQFILQELTQLAVDAETAE